MAGFDLAYILVAFQTAYVKLLCIVTAVCLGPWCGFQIAHHGPHPEDDDGSKKKLLILINTIFCCGVYILTLVVLAIPDKQSVLLLWLISCTVALVGHWAIYFISFRYFRSSLEELWLPLAILTIVFMAVYALPLFYIHFINWITNKKRSNQSGDGSRGRSRSAAALTNARQRGYAEVMQLPTCNIRETTRYNTTSDAHITDRWQFTENGSKV